MTGPFQPPYPPNQPGQNQPGQGYPSYPGPSANPPPSQWPSQPTPGYPSQPAPAAWPGGGFPPAGPPPNPEERVTKGGGGALWWIVGAIGVVVVLLMVAVVSLAGDGNEEAGRDTNTGTTTPLGSEDEGGEQGSSGDDPGGSGNGDEFGAGIPFRPDSVALSDDAVWITDADCGAVVKIDRATEEVVGSTEIGGSAAGVTVANGSVWVGSRFDSNLLKVDPDLVRIEDRVPVPGSALGLSSTEDGSEVWATNPLDAEVYRVDAATGDLIETIAVGNNAHHIAIEELGGDDRVIWVTNPGDNNATRITTGDRTTSEDIAAGPGALHVELGHGSAWVTNGADGTVHRINQDTGREEAVIAVGIAPHALAVTSDAVWVGTETGTFWKINIETNEATEVAAVFNSIDTAVDGDEIWIADTSRGHVVHFNAAQGRIVSTIDLLEFGDCEVFRRPPSIDDI